MSLPVLGPFPCGAARCECTKGGCDHLGACSPDEVAATIKADAVAVDRQWWAEVDATVAEWQRAGIPASVVRERGRKL